MQSMPAISFNYDGYQSKNYFQVKKKILFNTVGKNGTIMTAIRQVFVPGHPFFFVVGIILAA
jgi:hypothetical protein